MKKTQFIRITLFLSFACLVLAFQNCSQEIGEFNQVEKTADDGIPFAFDADIDRFAYMSCANGEEQNPFPKYFTFRVKTSDKRKSGLRLSNEFLDYVAAKGGTEEKALKFLSQSSKINNAVLQFNIVDSLNHELMIYKSGTTDIFPVYGSNAFNEMSSLLAGQYSALDNLRFTSSLDFRKYGLEGVVEINDSLHRGSIFLSLNYSDENREFGKVRTRNQYGEDVKGVYGRVFRLEFVPEGKVSSNLKRINSMREYISKGENSENNRINIVPGSGGWNSFAHYKIAKNQDINSSNQLKSLISIVFTDLTTSYINSISDSGLRKEMTLLYEMLGDGWRVSTTKDSSRYISYKDDYPGCYSTLSNIKYLDADLKECVKGQFTDPNTKEVFECVNYLSLSYR